MSYYQVENNEATFTLISKIFNRNKKSPYSSKHSFAYASY